MLLLIKFIYMNIKRFKTLAVILVILFLTPLFFFISKFKCHDISDNISDWGAFGDYFGGILNPILTFMNLIILIFLTNYIHKKEGKREKKNLERQYKPMGNFQFKNSNEYLQVDFESFGMGPLIINKFYYEDAQGKVYYDFRELFATIDDNMKYPNSTIFFDMYKYTSNKGLAISSSINIFKIKFREFNKYEEEYLNYLKEKLTEFKLILSYQDMFGKQIETISTNMKFI